MNDYGYNMRNYSNFDAYITENKQLSVIVNRPPELLDPSGVFKDEITGFIDKNIKPIKKALNPLFGHTLKTFIINPICNVISPLRCAEWQTHSIAANI